MHDEREQHTVKKSSILKLIALLGILAVVLGVPYPAHARDECTDACEAAQCSCIMDAFADRDACNAAVDEEYCSCLQNCNDPTSCNDVCGSQYAQATRDCNHMWAAADQACVAEGNSCRSGCGE